MPDTASRRLPVPAPNPDYAGTPLAAIDWGAHRDLSDGVLSVGFVPGGSTVVDGDGDRLKTVDWSPAQKSAAVDALELFATFLPITIEVRSSARADFVLSLTADDIDYYGEMQTPEEASRQSAVFSVDAFSAANGKTAPGGLGFQTMIHEFGHGFGLAHPHDEGGISDVMLGVTEGRTSRVPYTTGYLGLNQGIYTMMSYNDGYVTSPDGLSPTNLGFERTPMAFDIAVLQDAYGVNGSFATGNDHYVLPHANARGTGWIAIWDAGGHDEIRHEGREDALIDLRPATLQYERGGGGFISRVDGVYGGFTIAAGVIIEDALGGRGDDMIFGNGVANTLRSRGGDDTVFGFEGADRIRSGGGDDVVAGGEGADRISGGSGEDALSGNEGADILWGGTHDDILFGALGDDTLSGQRGDDELSGGNGDDLILGQRGDDAVEAGPGDDLVDTGDGDDEVLGGLGDDSIGTGAGDDAVLAGKGGDTVRGGFGDDLLFATTGADHVVGGPGADSIRGGIGGDNLFGGGGSDRIVGGRGSDLLSGGGGADAFVCRPGEGPDLIADFQPGQDVLEALGFGFANGAAVLATASSLGADTVLQLDAETVVRLADIAVDALSAGDFLTG